MSVKGSTAQRQLWQGLVQNDPRVMHSFLERMRKKTFAYFQKQHTNDKLLNLEECFNDALTTFLKKLSDKKLQLTNLEGLFFRIVQRNFQKRMQKEAKMHAFLEQYSYLSENINYPGRWSNTSLDEAFRQLSPKVALWFRQLPKIDQEILKLSFQQYKQKEIAEKLGITHGGVRNKYSKLIQAARKLANH